MAQEINHPCQSTEIFVNEVDLIKTVFDILKDCPVVERLQFYERSQKLCGQYLFEKGQQIPPALSLINSIIGNLPYNLGPKGRTVAGEYTERLLKGGCKNYDQEPPALNLKRVDLRLFARSTV
ncbi:hypothetical protein KW795_00070 [Candidatus Microgenomates bacterium]|nr:hypothetical protein [Candidatus Microgenomates bacterium]